ncbi:MAG: IPT/TIG domain-containing protein [Elusimicrobia bacterium]|nr:IPT/TIG domain-containing protein [Elusimicrobiota bacterium]
MSVNSIGNIGIGTTGPGNKLDVYSAGSAFIAVTGTGNSGFTVKNNTGAQTWNTYTDNSGFYRVDRAGGGSEFAIDSSGRVGIGTAGPATTLDVNGGISAHATGGQAFHAVGRAGDNFAWAPVVFANDGVTYTGGMSYAPAAVMLSTGGSSLAPLTTWLPSGRVGIGTTNPAAKLDINGTDALKIPFGTIAQRPVPAVNGMLRFNSEIGNLEYYYNSGWNCVGGVFATGGSVPGGEVVGSYRIHKFTASGTFNVVCDGKVEVLVVAGGGSGGGSNGTSIGGGGGGAGGVVYNSAVSVSQGSIAVTVGAGGIGVSGFAAGNNGGDSVFSILTAKGGGYGGTWTIAPTVGGSGGGAGENGQSLDGAAGTSGQGFGGGNDNGYDSGTPSAGGGGGGAGQTGGYSRSDITGGYGGIGSPYLISGTPAYYGGGGGGSGSTARGAGGWGGGGDGKGVATGLGTNGAANTGGGGGGSLTNASEAAQPGGNGGSGMVIIRYPIVANLTVPAITTVSPAYGPQGTVITITGTGFVAGGKVYVGTVEAVVNTLTATQITATTPASATGGARTVTVLNLPDQSYGMKAIAFTYMMSATGGTESNVGGYHIHTFTAVGTSAFTVATGGSVEVLVVAGGGGGGGQLAGGGGAGGYNYVADFAVVNAAYSLSVGAGGAGGPATAPYNMNQGTNGGNSVFATITSIGGGGGGVYDNTYAVGKNGGSGGGGGDSDTAPQRRAGGSGTAGQGYQGGSGEGGTAYYVGGGGGGAGGPGVSGASFVRGGNGGAGLQSTISGTPAYYASCGGGNAYYGYSTIAGVASPGGGGNGGRNGNGGNATANTGGGGGGGDWNVVSGGNGGSGIVIIRYPTNPSLWDAAPSVTSVSPVYGRGGSAVTLTGSNFATPAAVTIGGLSAQATTVDSGHITAIIPFLASTGVYNIVVTNPGGQSSTLTGALTATVYAAGGTESDSADYHYHTFYYTDPMTVFTGGNVDTLLVAGGGSGGNYTTTNANGGGGGGGMISKPTFAVTPQTYSVTVGLGGVAVAASTNHQGYNGGNSIFSSLTAIGGGGGGGTGAGSGLAGGSGGGAAYNNSGGGASQPGGFANAGGSAGYTWTGAGGGGAGSPGISGNFNPNASPSGNGGAGYPSILSGALQYYAGGGGGSGNSSERAGDGYHGGGRGEGTTSQYNYNVYTVGINATTKGSGTPTAIVNSGGGGGGGSYWASNGGWSTGSGAGGSGYVVVRYSTDPTLWNAQPTLTSISPSYGTGRGQYPITLTGSNFATPAAVTIGGVTVEATTIDSQHISVIVPVLPAGGMEDVVVTNPGGLSSTRVKGFAAMAYATGGTESDSGLYHIQKFTGGGTLSVLSGGPVEALVVGGGGGGAGGLGGGGGGGGVLKMTATVTQAGYAVVVGGGGAGGVNGTGSNGGASTIFGATAAGGGAGGGPHAGTNGVAGGSGGGCSSTDSQMPVGGASSGNNLGGNPGTIYGNQGASQIIPRTGSPCRGGGGGGAGGPAPNVDDNSALNTSLYGGGSGGIGITSDILGTNYYWAGGGGGGTYSPGYAGYGGLGGGGGGGAQDGAGYNGAGGGSALNSGGTGGNPAGVGGTNTGGGGGGSLWQTTTGGAGGSGIVVVRYSNNFANWDAAPSLTSVSPVKGSTIGGNTMTLTGSNFSAPASVTIGGVPVIVETTVNSGQIIVVMPNLGSAGAKDVVVTNLGGQSSTLSGAFTAYTMVVAQGGVESDWGLYHIHTFNSAATFNVLSGGTVEALVVAGGGSGGNHSTTNANGGGGGGCVVENGAVTVTAQPYNVLVGVGGLAIANATNARGNNGSNSVFSTLTAIGGGGGGGSGSSGGPGLTGGSGGGGAYVNGYAGNSNPGGGASQPGGYANAGGASNYTWTGGGGGGAGGAGVAGNVCGNCSPSGNGGTGYATAISGSKQYYAGGGGGSGNSSERAGDGYHGGGRGEGTTSFYNYNSYPVQVNATTGGSGTPTAIANTGGGGGGGSYWASNGGWGSGSGAGAIGVVIIRYSKDPTNWGAAPNLTGVTPGFGKAVGGYSLTLTGSGFSCPVGVTIGGVSATQITTINSTQITAIGPALPIGTKDIVVTNQGGQSSTLAGQFIVANLVSATGGTESDSGGYHIHKFLVNDTFNVLAGGTIEVLVVAGGGGGGSDMGGGGGGGGVVYSPSYNASVGANTIIIGGGGAGAPAGVSQAAGSNGGNSSFPGLATAIGGGGGGSEYSVTTHPAGNGGSGGGASAGAQLPSSSYGGNRGTGTYGQGYDGGWGIYAWYAGGGGGANGPGQRIPYPGGPGVLNPILGPDYYWGGGGGGGGYSDCGGSGGIGGGGGGAVCATTGGAGYNNGAAGGGGVINSQTNTPGGAAGANTGGGGGGGSHYNSNNYGGAGGSGIVIVRYPTDPTLWNAQPALTNISPASGSGRGGYPVTLTGSNFAIGAIVTIGGVQTAATTVNSTQIRAIVRPLTAAGFLDVVITNPGGLSSTLSQAFTATPSASGGAESTSGTYRIHTFLGTDVLTVPTGGKFDVLVVAGGGGGGGDVGGGGGGGLVYSPVTTLTNQAYTVTVGGGVAGGSNTASNGGNSVLASITAYGGGAGGGWAGQAGAAGGSGGGATSNMGFSSGGAAPYSGQGYPGGGGGGNQGGQNEYSGSGGGGGAGHPGGVGVSPGDTGVLNWSAGSTTSGYGGNGLQYDISGAWTYYAGGGGSSSDGNSYYGAGGLGGGARGGTSYPGTANTGGGGGGGNGAGAAGGSGIVIVRYSTDSSLWTATPSLTSVSPVSGRARTVITLTGSNFANPAVVTVGGITAAATFVNSTQITAVVPVQTSIGPKNVVVTNPGGGSSTKAGGFTATVSAIGGAESDSGGYHYHTFTGTYGLIDDFIVDTGGPVQVFVWGAGGAGGRIGGWNYGSYGGGGGAASGIVTVANNTLYPVVAGRFGMINSYWNYTNVLGVGGGGYSSNGNADNQYSGGGGGYSGIFLTSIAQGNSILIAGGGGGGSSSDADGPLGTYGTGNSGGGGGGTTGQAGYCPYIPSPGLPGNPGTQSAAGASVTSGSCFYSNGTGLAAGALSGGVTWSYSYAGGGGGGYWGGSAGGYYNCVPHNMCGGGGGSGYYNPGYVTGAILTQAVGATPGDSANPLRGSYGNGGPYTGNGNNGNPGVVVIRYATDASLWAATPSLTGVSPAAGRTSGRYTITLTGSNFAAGATVTIGGIAANAVTVNSGQITVFVPDLGSAGAKNIVVTNPSDGSSTLTGGFTAFNMVYALGGTESDSGGYHYHTYNTKDNFTVVSGGTVQVFAWGGGGAGGSAGWVSGSPGGAGGAANGTVTVANGTVYPVVVGGPGVVNSAAGLGAIGGGGTATGNGSGNSYTGGGGGYSGLFVTSVAQGNAYLIAGGGGGGGNSRAEAGNGGGGGGGTSGQRGFSMYDGKTAYGGNPGTQSAAADASCDGITNAGGQGALQGGVTKSNSYGGGGGGGYWGGSGGGYSEPNTMAGGGGGSAYYNPSYVNAANLTAAYATTPGDSANSLRGSAGNAGGVAANGTSGIVVIRYPTDASLWAATPSLTSVSPAVDSPRGGDPVTLSGSNFAVGATVTIGGVAAKQVTTVNSGQITAIVPPQAAGVKDVVVINPGGQISTLTGGLNVYNMVYGTGGMEYNSGGYHIHKFNQSDTFTVVGSGNVDVLVVAGGGSGGNYSTTNANGGGGGGGVIVNNAFPVTAQAYAVTVGYGGNWIANSTNARGNNGGNSVFSSLTALGGGGGGSTGTGAGLTGGSGGGATNNYGGGGANQPGGFANAGGAAGYTWTGGGGGGAGAAGISGNVCGNCAPSGNGGYGFPSALSGALQYYAGGGGGAGNSTERAGDGYHGGGRGEGTTSQYNYNVYTNQINGTTLGSGYPNAVINTGGGGGGGSYWAANGGWSRGSGAGGAGIVIVRYSNDPSLWSAQPTLSSISPTYGPGKGQYTVTLSGSNFATPAAVTIGGTTLEATTVNSGQITAVVPPLAAGGMKDVVVTNPGGLSSTLTKGFAATMYATGGTESDWGLYHIHTFTGSGTLSVATGGNVDALVIAGGGGGGGQLAGGGGAGGYSAVTSFPITNTAYAVTVGGGGAGGPATSPYSMNRGSNGGNSIFSSITSIGGGGGGVYNDTYAPGNSGGSGGGAGDSDTAPTRRPGGAGTAGQGYAGGSGEGSPAYYVGGGGGGAGGPGENSVSQVKGGNGGPGRPNDITGTLTYYASGGGGNGYYGYATSQGFASAGGGANGARGSGANGPAATANTGGGGGGGDWNVVSGGAGGSGIVIVRYSKDPSYWNSAPSLGSISPTFGNPAGGYMLTLTGSGFAAPATVSIGGVAVQQETTVNSGQITVLLPNLGSGGAKDVVVTNPGGQSSTLTGGFTAYNMVSATGGTESDWGPYHIHTFYSGASSLNVLGGGNVEVLVVAGGGGGGSDMGGGGGAGGVVYNPSYAVSAGAYSVNVGAGGAGAPAGVNQVRGTSGGNSLFLGVTTAIGGGGGGSEYSTATNPAAAGGSGGGSASCTNPGPGAGTAGQGYAGGPNGGCYYPSGGGGAGGVGSTSPGPGGPGVRNMILGTAYYWGGGGGGGGYTVCGGNGGFGGGGGGATCATSGGTGGLNQGADGGGGYIVAQCNQPGGAGAANTGGGGGGGSHYNSNNPGGAGGSGIVVVRYSKDPSYWTSTPSLGSVSPNTGPTIGGYLITLNGSGFSAPATVTFGGVAATQVTTVNSGQLVVIMPVLTLGAKDVVVTNQGGLTSTLSGGFTVTTPLASCAALKTAGNNSDGVYWIQPAATPFRAYCDMTTNGGGWTLVANIAPADGNSVGYNAQNFWTTQAEYRNFDNSFASDYKSPAAYGLAADYLMIESANTGAAGSILGWRSWPMTSHRTFGSFFTTGIVAVHGTDACETGAPNASSVGSTSSQDDIIRQGGCLYADVNPSSSGEADLIRLSPMSYNVSQDNMMAGFGSCIDCGTTWQGAARPYMGIDRAACGAASCNYSQICRVANPASSADCLGSYCSGTYGSGVCNTLWNSRFFVK